MLSIGVMMELSWQKRDLNEFFTSKNMAIVFE